MSTRPLEFADQDRSAPTPNFRDAIDAIMPSSATEFICPCRRNSSLKVTGSVAGNLPPSDPQPAAGPFLFQPTMAMTITIKRHAAHPDLDGVTQYFGVARGNRPVVVDVHVHDLSDKHEHVSAVSFLTPSGEDASPEAVLAVKTYGLRDPIGRRTVR
jgi:hypothetical protein